MNPVNYYATIPAWILSDKKLSYGEKIVCALLSAMSQRDGYCFATNVALAETLGITEGAIKMMMGRLEAAGFISVLNKRSRTAGSRQIRLLFTEKICANVAAEEEEVVEEAPDLVTADHNFNRFYELYPRKEKRIPALKMFNSRKLDRRIDALLEATRIYCEEVVNTPKEFIMHPATFLNNSIWEERITTENVAKKISNGAAAEPMFGSFRAKCVELFYVLFNGGHLDMVEDASLYSMGKIGNTDFSQKDIAAIQSAGGFAHFIKNSMDDAYMYEQVKPLWEAA